MGLCWTLCPALGHNFGPVLALSSECAVWVSAGALPRVGVLLQPWRPLWRHGCEVKDCHQSHLQILKLTTSPPLVGTCPTPRLAAMHSGYRGCLIPRGIRRLDSKIAPKQGRVFAGSPRPLSQAAGPVINFSTATASNRVTRGPALIGFGKSSRVATQFHSVDLAIWYVLQTPAARMYF